MFLTIKNILLDEEGVTLFAFHGNINEEFNGREAGQFARDITKAKNGRWTFVDKLTKFKPGDKIYYWTYVIYDDGKNKLGYANDDQEYTVTGKNINRNFEKFIELKNIIFI